jgi:hypothetical protein
LHPAFKATADGIAGAAVLWSAQAPAGINSFPAATKDMLIVGAGAPNGSTKRQDELVAYSLGGRWRSP